MTSPTDKRPRRGWSMPRIVENSDTFQFINILYAKEIDIDSENNEYM
jgi:hypothetical protein